MELLFEKSAIQTGATFSPCRTWRYRLWRIWDESLPMLAVIGLNPSTANESEDDPTIRRCIGFARSFECGGLWMLNAFAFCATKPDDMWKFAKSGGNIIGPDNDAHILEVASSALIALACWGAHIRKRPERARAISKLMGGKPLHCLRLLSDGTPEHPLYLPGTCKPQLWSPTP